MMVDDEPTNLKLAEAMLRSAGYQNMVMVQDSRLALSQHRSSPADLILLDLNMPHLDGYALMDQFHALNDPLLPPILVLTAQGGRDHLLRTLEAGARDFVAKPFDRSELLMRVRNLIEAHLSHRALHEQRDDLEQRVKERTSQLELEISQRRKAQEAQHALLQEKEGLLREIHHRVKNNLQVIASLLRLEAARGSQTLNGNSLEDMQGRIRAMALLHESLYSKDTFASLDLAGYLRQLATQSLRAMAVHGGAVRLELSLEPVRIGIDQAGPCGLLVNELVSNALKHGFPKGRTGSVKVELKLQESSNLHRAEDRTSQPIWLNLSVMDTGVGLPEDFESIRQQSLGLKLAVDLARQIGGTLTIDSHPVTRFGVVFQVV